jgi:replicative DNA helicase
MSQSNGRPRRGGLSDHVPPHNLDAERSTLGAMLLDPETIHVLVGILEVDDFYRDAHQVIYRAIRDLYDQGKVVDAVTLSDELVRRDQYRQIGGDEMLLEIASSIPHAANAEYHARIVHEKASTRRLIQAATEIIRDAYSDLYTADQLFDMAEQNIFAITDRDAEGSLVPASRGIAEAMIEIQGRTGKPNGLMTGFGDLDVVLDGLKAGQLIVLAARTSHGKTSLALQTAANIAASSDLPALIFSLEMGHLMLWERLLGVEARLTSTCLRYPRNLAENQHKRLARAAESLGRIKLYVDDRPSLTLSKIGATARRLKARHGLGLVVVDYLSLVDAQKQKTESRQDEVARLSKGLKTLARLLDVPLIAVHQLNRENMKRKDRRPVLTDLRESGQIEQDADIVILLYRPSHGTFDGQPDVSDFEIAEAIVAKNRNGPCALVKLSFERGCMRFESAFTQEQGPAF